MPSPTSPQLKFQDPEHLLELKRSALHSHFRRAVDDLADTSDYPRLKAFLPQNLWPWVKDYLKYAFKRKHPFATYPTSGNQGVYGMRASDAGQVFRISISGDWGTGTAEAARVASAMNSFHPDYTIHLGDVYYVGDTPEVNENCLGQTVSGYQGVMWPKGKVGSFSMNGNHEMYANGNAYFDTFIKMLGVPASEDKIQLASFFCLENEYWRLLGLDTGYNSAGLPILGAIPIVNRIPFVGADCKLEDGLIQWLRATIQPKRKPLPTIVLTHHQCFSAFERGYPRPAKQLAEFFAGQEVVWIWGHEHRMAIYDRYTVAGIPMYARCVGHGGMPVELKAVSNTDMPLQYYDRRVYATYDNAKVGINGFLNIELAGNKVTLDYRDLDNQSVLVETFTSAGTAMAHAFVRVDPGLSKGSAASKPLAQPAGTATTDSGPSLGTPTSRRSQ